jgi:ubiquinone/menaquinone biosynthesis C-methylase UbiE
MSLLGDTPNRAFTHKLDRFNRFAEPELRGLIASLGIRATDSILDIGCGTGLMTRWLAEQAYQGDVLGIDLSHAHIDHAIQHQPPDLPLTYQQGDLTTLRLPTESLDWIWCSNTIHHLTDPVGELRRLIPFLRPGGTLLLGRSTFLPDMFFAWDERLEGEVMLACYQYYRDKYNISAHATTNARNYVGWATAAMETPATAKTITIERTAPLSAEEESYFLEVVFRGYWGYRVQPYLSSEDWQELEALTDPTSPRYCLKRPDFHHIQTYTIVSVMRT